MATPQYTALANITLSSSAASVTFSSISQAYRDLVLIGAPIAGSNGYGVSLRFNSDSASNYSIVEMRGTGSAAGSSAAAVNQAYLWYSLTYTTSAENNFVANIMDYSATDKHKTVISRSNTASTSTTAIAARWANTSAITSIIVVGNGNFAAGSTFALYGVK